MIFIIVFIKANTHLDAKRDDPLPDRPLPIIKPGNQAYFTSSKSASATSSPPAF